MAGKRNKADADVAATYDAITMTGIFAEIRLRAAARDYVDALDTRGEAKAYRALEAAARNLGRSVKSSRR